MLRVATLTLLLAALALAQNAKPQWFNQRVRTRNSIPLFRALRDGGDADVSGAIPMLGLRV